MKLKIIFTILLLLSVDIYSQSDSTHSIGNYLTFGIFIGKIEEGARIFTPVRLLPFDHPEALNHEFPTATQLYGSEFQTLLLLGEKCGLKLWATLSRYPQQPATNWPYPEFTQPPLSELANAEIVHKSAKDSPLPGLRSLAVYNDFLVCFIVDTRNLSLEERNMKRASAMGLDITRKDFINKLNDCIPFLNNKKTGIIVFDN
jgi:hypothetical protein